MTMAPPARSRSVRVEGTSRAGVPRLDWLLMLAVAGLLVLGTVLVWSATVNREDLTGGDPSAYLKKQLVNIAIGVVLGVMIIATDHRWVRILAPLVYVASVVGLVLVVRAAGKSRIVRTGWRAGSAISSARIGPGAAICGPWTSRMSPPSNRMRSILSWSA